MPLQNPYYVIVAVWLLAYLLDHFLAEPKKWHPLVGFGNAASALEKRCNRQQTRFFERLRGALAWCLVVLPPVLLVLAMSALLERLHWLFGFCFDALILYLAMGWRSLSEHIQPIASALAKGDLVLARQCLSWIVSRDTDNLSDAEVLSSAMESGLENSSDAFFASLFWYAVAGPAAVVLHRLANTLDAMWGYRSSRYSHFGSFAARCDDVLNFFPAQLTALSFSLLSYSPAAFRCWWGQGWRWKSINAGSVMASGAAALGVTLGGSARYHGQLQSRPQLGQGEPPSAVDVNRTLNLANKVFVLWLTAVLILGVLVAL